jgi:hypothetical protein
MEPLTGSSSCSSPGTSFVDKRAHPPNHNITNTRNRCWLHIQGRHLDHLLLLLSPLPPPPYRVSTLFASPTLT